MRASVRADIDIMTRVSYKTTVVCSHEIDAERPTAFENMVVTTAATKKERQIEVVFDQWDSDRHWDRQ